MTQPTLFDLPTPTLPQMHVYVVHVDGCRHDANALTRAEAEDLAAWCHGRGYCYHREASA